MWFSELTAAIKLHRAKFKSRLNTLNQHYWRYHLLVEKIVHEIGVQHANVRSSYKTQLQYTHIRADCERNSDKLSPGSLYC